MYKKIDNDPFFDDIKSIQAKNNLFDMVDYLCSMPAAEQYEKDILIDGSYKDKHNYVASIIYNEQNRVLVEDILKNRTKYSNIDSTSQYDMNGYASIYELDKDFILELGTMRFYKSISITEHELIHILMAVNKNNPKPQHNEILSFFGELLSLSLLSKKDNNPDIYENAFINRCIARMSFRVFPLDFSDEAIENNGQWIYEARRNSYPYMLGFIYACRLLDLYKCDEQNVLMNVNEVLSGNKKLETLLTEYNISLENKETCNSFIEACNRYNSFIEKRYKKPSLHSVK